MSAQIKKAANEAQFTFYQPARGNQLDLGFTLKGYRFRLVNPRKQERALDRAWMPCTANNLPQAFVAELKKHRPGFWGDDGLHRINNDLQLYFMTEEKYQEAQDYLNDRNMEDKMKLSGNKDHGSNVKSVGEYEHGAEAFKD